MSCSEKKFRFEASLNDVRSALHNLQVIDVHLSKHLSRNQRTTMYSTMEALYDCQIKLDNILKTIRTVKHEVPTAYTRMSEPVDGIDDLDEDIPF